MFATLKRQVAYIMELKVNKSRHHNF